MRYLTTMGFNNFRSQGIISGLKVAQQSHGEIINARYSSEKPLNGAPGVASNNRANKWIPSSLLARASKMEDNNKINPDSSMVYNSNCTMDNENCTEENEDETKESIFPDIFHQPIDVQIRVSVLWTIAVLGVLGNTLVLLRLFGNRGRRSRINLLIVHLTLADLLVVACAICPQLAWEYALRSWQIGDAMCRLVKFLQTVAISVSNYMVVVLAVDRYCAVRRPLKKPIPVSYMAGSAWGLAVTINMANFFLYETRQEEDAVYCRNLLYDHPKVYMQMYITTIAFFVLVLPFIVICYAYTRIFQKISRKASESKRSKRPNMKPGKIQLHATTSSTLPKAKAKTFKMTIVIVLSFLVCGTPYFVCDIWRIYTEEKISPSFWAILGALAVSNSSTNPFIYLSFNSKGWCFKLAIMSGTRTSSTMTRVATASALHRRHQNNNTPNAEHVTVESAVTRSRPSSPWPAADADAMIKGGRRQIFKGSQEAVTMHVLDDPTSGNRHQSNGGSRGNHVIVVTHNGCTL